MFGDLPEQKLAPSASEPAGRVRLREPMCDTVQLEVFDLDALIEADHPACAIWANAEQVNFAAFVARMNARERRPGQARTAPQLLLALWP